MPRRLHRQHSRQPMPPGSRDVARPSAFGHPDARQTYGPPEVCRRLFAEPYEHDWNEWAKVVRKVCGQDLWCSGALEAPCHADVWLRGGP
jgi:hypothetical protein